MAAAPGIGGDRRARFGVDPLAVSGEGGPIPGLASLRERHEALSYHVSPGPPASVAGAHQRDGWKVLLLSRALMTPLTPDEARKLAGELVDYAALIEGRWP